MDAHFRSTISRLPHTTRALFAELLARRNSASPILTRGRCAAASSDYRRAPLPRGSAVHSCATFVAVCHQSAAIVARRQSGDVGAAAVFTRGEGAGYYGAHSAHLRTRINAPQARADGTEGDSGERERGCNSGDSGQLWRLPGVASLIICEREHVQEFRSYFELNRSCGNANYPTEGQRRVCRVQRPAFSKRCQLRIGRP